jgi:hypothetical protein
LSDDIFCSVFPFYFFLGTTARGSGFTLSKKAKVKSEENE